MNIGNDFDFTVEMTAEDWLHKGYYFHYEGEFGLAAACWHVAAAMGDMLGKYYLAEAYRMGEGVAQDLVKAAALYEDVVACRELIDPDKPNDLLSPQCSAAFTLGKFHEEKLIPNASIEKALEYYNFAVADGNRYHICALAKLYLKNETIAKDYIEKEGALYAGFPFVFPTQMVNTVIRQLREAKETGVPIPGCDNGNLPF